MLISLNYKLYKKYPITKSKDQGRISQDQERLSILVANEPPEVSDQIIVPWQLQSQPLLELQV